MAEFLACKATGAAGCFPLCREGEDIEGIFTSRVPNSTPVRRNIVTGDCRRRMRLSKGDSEDGLVVDVETGVDFLMP